MRSVFQHTDEGCQLVLIDDFSSDLKIHLFLNYLEKKYPKRITLLKNAQNLGFVGTVNRGMQENPTHDVILLNTDTIVTKGWIEQLQTCAYSRENIATATPLSNNGNSICSVPMFNRVNQLPAGYTVDSFAALVNRASEARYPEIPTAVGFCMYIKRCALDELGLFDSESFGKGYGEETDFSRRAIQHGYINVLDDTTYIFHNGGASFNFSNIPIDERKKRGLEILKKRYPTFIPEWNRFIKTNPLDPVHRRIFFWMKCREWHIPEGLAPTLYLLYRTLKR